MFEGYTFVTVIGLLIIAAIFYGLYDTKKYNISFSLQVLIALLLGALFGYVLTLVDDVKIFGYGGLEILPSWLSLIGNLFTGLLKMIVVPLIFVMVIAAITNMPVGSKKVIRWVTQTIGLLVLFSLIGAVVGILSAKIFGLDASKIIADESIIERGDALIERAASTPESFVDLLKSMIPGNPFADLSGSRATSMIGVVIFSAFIGFGGYILNMKDSKQGMFFKGMINSAKEVIMIVVNTIIKFTPYGVFAIIANTIYSTKFDAIVELGKFVGASYFAIVATFLILLIPLVMCKLNPVTYMKKAWETLVFAFSSRSSAATVPKTYATQHKLLGVDEGLSSLSSSLGASIGQVG